MSQYELEAHTWNQRQARENSCEQVTIGLVLLLIGWENGAGFFNQSQLQRKVKQNYGKRKNVLTRTQLIAVTLLFNTARN